MPEVERYLTALPVPRQERIRHVMDVIERAAPGLPWRLWEYAGGVVGYGTYRYRYASGRTGEFFMCGVGNRKRYVAIYANAADGDRYLVETFEGRFPGCTIGKSCIQVPDTIVIDDDALSDLIRQTVTFFRAEFAKPKLPKTMQIWE